MVNYNCYSSSKVNVTAPFSTEPSFVTIVWYGYNNNILTTYQFKNNSKSNMNSKFDNWILITQNSYMGLGYAVVNIQNGELPNRQFW